MPLQNASQRGIARLHRELGRQRVVVRAFVQQRHTHGLQTVLRSDQQRRFGVVVCEVDLRLVCEQHIDCVRVFVANSPHQRCGVAFVAFIHLDEPRCGKIGFDAFHVARLRSAKQQSALIFSSLFRVLRFSHCHRFNGVNFCLKM